MTIKCIIVDDEYLAIRVIEGFCARIPDCKVLQTFKEPREALRFLQENEVDLVFLDIQMPHISGIELAANLSVPGTPAGGPLVVFTTARHEFAVRAFELEALDYLVKPIAFERFEKTIRKAREQVEELRPLDKDPIPDGEAPGTEEQAIPGFLLVKSDHRTIQLPYRDVFLIEGLNEYVKVHTSDTKIVTLAALKDLEARLPKDRFVRIHRSYIISLPHMRSWNASMVEMTGGLRLPVGRVYKDNFLRQAGRPAR